MKKTAFIYLVFICYILFLLELFFFSRVSFLDLFNSQRPLDRTINIIPFYSIKKYTFGSSITIKNIAFINVFGNILVFIPFGLCLSFFKNNKRVISNLLLIFAISLFIEIIQWILGIGFSDVDDIILNFLGGFIGILVYKFLLLIFGYKEKVSVALTILSAMALPVLLYLLFVVRLRL